MESLDMTSAFIAGGFVLAIILTIVFVAVYRRAIHGDQEPAKLPEIAEAERPAPRAEGLTTTEEAVLTTGEVETSKIETAERRLKSVAPPATAQTGVAEAAGRPHTLEEIQRHPPKALSTALENTRTSFFGRLKLAFSKKEILKAGELEDVEEILYTSDLGPQTVQRLMGAVEEKLKGSGGSGFEVVREALKAEMLEIFDTLDEQTKSKANGNGARPNGSAKGDGHDWDEERAIVAHAGQDYVDGLERLNVWSHKPAVLMIVGVNGAGKTTTIGKLSRRIAQSGRRVLVAAGDTFRAAAGDQLKVWVDRAQVEIFAPPGVSDPSAVAFDAVQTAVAKGFDMVIIDTAGRLHTQKNLMEELKKMKRVIDKVLPGAPHEVLLVLDANSGQNALVQAREFNGAVEISGVVSTKLDGTAKGGVAIGLACELGLPIKLIGVGEGIEDLRRFSSREFVDSII